MSEPNWEIRVNRPDHAPVVLLIVTPGGRVSLNPEIAEQIAEAVLRIIPKGDGH